MPGSTLTIGSSGTNPGIGLVALTNVEATSVFSHFETTPSAYKLVAHVRGLCKFMLPREKNHQRCMYQQGTVSHGHIQGHSSEIDEQRRNNGLRANHGVSMSSNCTHLGY